MENLYSIEQVLAVDIDLLPPSFLIVGGKSHTRLSRDNYAMLVEKVKERRKSDQRVTKERPKSDQER